MARHRLRAAVGTAMVILGLVQAGLGIASDQLVYAGLGVLYGSFGVAYLYAEVYAVDR